jgi:hypothetical protein
LFAAKKEGIVARRQSGNNRQYGILPEYVRPIGYQFTATKFVYSSTSSVTRDYEAADPEEAKFDRVLDQLIEKETTIYSQQT